MSKFMNDLLPTRRRLQKLDNKTDGRCFACNLLWEDTNHVLCCISEARSGFTCYCHDNIPTALDPTTHAECYDELAVYQYGELAQSDSYCPPDMGPRLLNQSNMTYFVLLLHSAESAGINSSADGLPLTGERPSPPTIMTAALAPPLPPTNGSAPQSKLSGTFRSLYGVHVT